MKKRRIIWGMILVVLIINMVLSESAAGLYLFFGALLIPLAGVIISILAIKAVETEIALPKTCAKRQVIRGSIHVAATGVLPVTRGEVHVHMKNLLTTETLEETITTGFTRQGETLAFSLQNEHCGVIEIMVDRISVYDPFGLWKKVVQLETKAVVTVLPDTFPLHLELAHGKMPNSDSIEYAQGRTGNDASEIFAIREYQEGDSIRNIHWKLSSKCDDLMVKLASLPLENSMLLLLETALQDEEELQPAAFDALAEIYITISQTLVDNEINHKVGWYDHQAQRMFIFEVNDEDDLHGIMGKILAVTRSMDGIDAISRYLDEMGHFEQAHIVYVTHKDEGCMEAVPDEMIKTAVVCSEKGARALGVYDYTCTPKDYPVQLRSMTI